MTATDVARPRLLPDARPSAALVDRLLRLASVSAGAPVTTVRAPFDDGPLYDLPHSTEADVDEAVRVLREGQRAWAARSLAERSRIILRFHDLVLARRDEGLDLAQWETGKARKDAMEELLDICITARHYSRDASRLLRPRRHRGALPGLVGATQVQHPKGIVGVLAPWNYPLTLAITDALPALLAGNAILLKPDVQTTVSALWVIDLLIESGVPESVVKVVVGEGPVLGPWVIDRVDYVMFTGSTRVGREVAARCGERLIGCSLELGGKNAMIVRADADVRRAADIAARGSFSNAGQLCISMERIYVHADVHDAFLSAFVERIDRLRMSPGLNWDADIGSLISARQLTRVHGHVLDAVARGATVVAGGRARPDIGPFYMEPTVLTGVTDSMALCDEETFGPVVAVYPVASDEEAVARANDTAYGLNGSIVTRDLAVGRAMAARLKSGTVNVNEAYAPSWGSIRSPMGGMGDSGLGRRHGDEGLLKYTESQTIATQRLLSFGPQFGLSHRQWTSLLAGSLGAMKRLGMK